MGRYWLLHLMITNDVRFIRLIECKQVSLFLPTFFLIVVIIIIRATVRHYYSTWRRFFFDTPFIDSVVPPQMYSSIREAALLYLQLVTLSFIWAEITDLYVIEGVLKVWPYHGIPSIQSTVLDCSLNTLICWSPSHTDLENEFG